MNRSSSTTPARSRLARALVAPARIALASALLCACAARVGSASICCITCSDAPGHINLVGASPAGIDPAGEFVVVVRDRTNAPCGNSTVVVDLSGAGDLRLATDPFQAGATVDCPSGTIRTVTDADGVARFRIVGGSRAGSPSSFAPNVQVSFDGVLLATVSVGALDLDGSGGLGGSDLSIWLDDFGIATNPSRSDYDGDGAVGGADLAAWLTAYGASGSTQSGSGYCQ